MLIFCANVALGMTIDGVAKMVGITCALNMSTTARFLDNCVCHDKLLPLALHLFNLFR